MNSKSGILFSIFFLFLSLNISLAQKKDPISFAERSKTSRYISFSFGMGVSYCNNPSLKTFVEYELPFYNTVPVNDRLSSFYTGIEFFGGAEFQLSKKISIKGEYSYFSKSYNSSYFTQYQNYEFTYYSHQPLLTLYYIIPQENSFIKIGASAGYLFSNFTQRVYGAQSNYNSTGITLRLNAVLDIQMGKNLAGYLSVFANKTFQSDLKDSNGNLLLNNSVEIDPKNKTVNLNSLGVGVRVGLEFFIF